MGKINTGILKDFTDGTYVHDVDFDNTFEIIRTAINDNYDKIVNRYTKAEVDGLLVSIGAGVATSIAVSPDLPAGAIQGKFLLKTPENTIYYYTGASWIAVSTAAELTAAQATLNTTITNHTGNVNNPHAVTAAQVGAIPATQKGAVSGVASLDANSVLTQSQRFGFELLFGNGSDGNVTLSSNTTLVRDMYYNTLTINSGIKLTTQGYRIFVKDTLINNGTIENNGANGVSGSGATYGGSVLGGIGGGNSGQGAVNANGTSAGNMTGLGGTGGTGGTVGGTGGGGGIITMISASVMNGLETITSVYTFNQNAGGGGGGGGSNSPSWGSGSGGGGGGYLFIYARTITNNGTISANGGTGGNGANGTNAGGGGGGGGGYVIVFYKTYTGNSAVATGGTGGTGGTVGGNGASGQVKMIKAV